MQNCLHLSLTRRFFQVTKKSIKSAVPVTIMLITMAIYQNVSQQYVFTRLPRKVYDSVGLLNCAAQWLWTYKRYFNICSMSMLLVSGPRFFPFFATIVMRAGFRSSLPWCACCGHWALPQPFQLRRLAAADMHSFLFRLQGEALLGKLSTL